MSTITLNEPDCSLVMLKSIWIAILLTDFQANDFEANDFVNDFDAKVFELKVFQFKRFEYNFEGM